MKQVMSFRINAMGHHVSGHGEVTEKEFWAMLKRQIK